MAQRKSSRKQTAGKLRVSQLADGSWELVEPRCARARREDIEEVEQMIDAGETEIAQDELRWLLSECHDFLLAHKLLGDIALAAGDVRLARGHYGYAYQLGLAAIQAGGVVKQLPYQRAANRAFFDAGRGVADCLTKMGKRRMAKDVIERLLLLDPSDPLQLRGQPGSGRGPCGN